MCTWLHTYYVCTHALHVYNLLIDTVKPLHVLQLQLSESNWQLLYGYLSLSRASIHPLMCFSGLRHWVRMTQYFMVDMAGWLVHPKVGANTVHPHCSTVVYCMYTFTMHVIKYSKCWSIWFPFFLPVHCGERLPLTTILNLRFAMGSHYYSIWLMYFYMLISLLLHVNDVVHHTMPWHVPSLMMYVQTNAHTVHCSCMAYTPIDVRISWC